MTEAGKPLLGRGLSAALLLLLWGVGGLRGQPAAPPDLAQAFPAAGARAICPDTPLELTFPVAPSVVSIGVRPPVRRS